MTLTLSQPEPHPAAPVPSEAGLPDAPASLISPPDFGTIRLSGHAATVTAEDLRAQLVMAADHAGATEIDASESLSVGQAVLQLLIAARAEAAERDHDFLYTGASAAFRDRVVACRLADAIGLEIGKECSR